MDRLRKIKLSAEEDEGVQLEEVDEEHSREECERSLAGRIFGEKNANFSGLKNTFTAIWPTKEPIQGQRVGFQFLSVCFQNTRGQKESISRKVWSFDKKYLILKEWSAEMKIHEEDFNCVDF